MKETHYSPLEYRIAFEVFKELKPDLYDTISKEFSMYSNNKTMLNPIFLLNSLNYKKEEIGDTIYSMYYNLYEGLSKTKQNNTN
jgi:hypothetical protein